MVRAPRWNPRPTWTGEDGFRCVSVVMLISFTGIGFVSFRRKNDKKTLPLVAPLPEAIDSKLDLCHTAIHKQLNAVHEARIAGSHEQRDCCDLLWPTDFPARNE